MRSAPSIAAPDARRAELRKVRKAGEGGGNARKWRQWGKQRKLRQRGELRGGGGERRRRERVGGRTGGYRLVEIRTRRGDGRSARCRVGAASGRPSLGRGVCWRGAGCVRRRHRRIRRVTSVGVSRPGQVDAKVVSDTRDGALYRARQRSRGGQPDRGRRAISAAATSGRSARKRPKRRGSTDRAGEAPPRSRGARVRRVNKRARSCRGGGGASVPYSARPDRRTDRHPRGGCRRQVTGRRRVARRSCARCVAP